jgi:hypothetical protein
MTTVTMYDSDNLDDIPPSAAAVMFYCDGEPGTATPAQLARFAGRPMVSCTRRAMVAGRVADIEPGCIWPPAAAAPHFANGLSDTAYGSLSDMPAIRTALNGLCDDFLVADYDGVPSVPAGYVGKQYIDPPASGGHWDLSVVDADWLSGTTPSAKGTEPMGIIIACEGQATLWVYAGKTVGFPDEADVAAMQGAGVGVAHVTLPFYQGIVAAF